MAINNDFFPGTQVAPQASFWGGSPAGFIRAPKFNAEQQAIMQGLSQRGMDIIQNLGNLPSFEPIAQQARQRFTKQTLPGLAERFTSRGGGALSSPSFAAQYAGAGAGLEADLAAQQAQYDLSRVGQERNFGVNLAQLGMTPMFDQRYVPESPGFGQELGTSALGILGKVAPYAISTGIGGLTGGPMGAFIALLSSLGRDVSPENLQALARLFGIGRMQ